MLIKDDMRKVLKQINKNENLNKKLKDNTIKNESLRQTL